MSWFFFKWTAQKGKSQNYKNSTIDVLSSFIQNDLMISDIYFQNRFFSWKSVDPPLIFFSFLLKLIIFYAFFRMKNIYSRKYLYRNFEGIRKKLQCGNVIRDLIVGACLIFLTYYWNTSAPMQGFLTAIYEFICS